VGGILALAIWPAGIVVIVVVALLLASRSESAPAVPAKGMPSWLAREPAAAQGPGRPAAQAVRAAARFLLLIVAGLIAVYLVMALLGLLVTHEGHFIDVPLNRWVSHHRVHQWAQEMSKATKVGDTWTTRGAALTAAVCLAVSWRRMRWLPQLALATLAVIQHPLTRLIHLTEPRVGPPGFVHGTFPSGGSERCVAFYGLIAYLLWREFSGRRRAAIWSGAAVAAIAFNEGYSRVYLGMHWATDALSGWIYGLLLLLAFVTAVRLVAGPAGPAGRPAAARAEPVAVPPARAPAVPSARASAGEVPR
jgi:membrane-associated phospholipid phosphatase